MKKLIIFSLLSNILVTLQAQELMTIGEIFDFDINDEFHMSGNADYQPPNADRKTVINKFYSNNGETVNYVFYHDAYATTLEQTTLTYTFFNYIDTVSYSNLDSSISLSAPTFVFDTLVLYDECGTLLNHAEKWVGEFEPNNYVKSFGKGIGLIRHYHFAYGGYGGVLFDKVIFYYKKGEIECGNPSTITSLSNIQEESEIKLFPNPATSVLNIEVERPSDDCTFIIYSTLGKEILFQRSAGRINTIDIADLKAGIYFIHMTFNKRNSIMKFVKE